MNNLRLRGPAPSASSHFHSSMCGRKMADPQFEISGGFLKGMIGRIDAYARTCAYGLSDIAIEASWKTISEVG